MALSVISNMVSEGQPLELSSFIRAGVSYVVWYSVVGDIGVRKLNWKPHSSGDFTEITPTLTARFNHMSTIYDPATDHLVVVWDDGLAVEGRDGSIFIARFNPVTGALISGPTELFPGSRPRMCYRSSTINSRLLLYYMTAKNDGVYGRISDDGGLTWEPGYPLYTGQVRATANVEVVPYDETHATVGQVGEDARALKEIASLVRTRPLQAIVQHPSVSTDFFIGEPSRFDSVTLTDNLRGGLVLATDNSKLYHLDGVRAGTPDSINTVARISVSGVTISVVSSAGPVGGVSGRNLVGYTLDPVLGTPTITLPGATSYAVGLAVSAGYAYVAEYSDSTTAGQLVIVNLGTSATAAILTGITAVRAVAVANFPTTPLIFVASTESGVERLRVYQENGLAPTLLLNTKLPARANSITVTADPTNPSGALLYVSMVDRLNIYRYTSSAYPVLLLDSLTSPGGGSFFQSVQAPNGNVVVAAGLAGVMVVASDGHILSQNRASGESVKSWVRGTAYLSGTLVKPTKTSPFTASRYFFKCFTGGFSGSSEPRWASTGSISDNTATWQPMGRMDGVVTGIALDATLKRIYAVGVAGGDLGTDGRVWIFDAKGML